MNTQAELLNAEGDYSLVSWTGRKFPGLLVHSTDRLEECNDDRAV